MKTKSISRHYQEAPKGQNLPPMRTTDYRVRMKIQIKTNMELKLLEIKFCVIETMVFIGKVDQFFLRSF